MFGYVRGTHLKAGQRVHVIGAGDFGMAEVTALEDPCPLPTKEKVANRCGDAYVRLCTEVAGVAGKAWVHTLVRVGVWCSDGWGIARDVG